MTQPIYSIITATLNSASTLPKLIESIRNQTISSWELIIIDGGSTDGTIDVIAEYETHISYWESHPDGGIYHAWNKALHQATGSWLLFLGGDDYLWSATVLANVSEALSEHRTDQRVAYGQLMLISERGEPVTMLGEPWPKASTSFSSYMSIPHPATFHHRDLFRIHGQFDESFRIAGDYEFLLREVPTSEPLYLPGIIVTGMRQGGISSNPRNVRRLNWEVWKARHLHGQTSLPPWLPPSLLLPFYWLAKAVLRPKPIKSAGD